jgi:4-hydroxy-2-oxoheptanedioate aldolase
MNTLRAKRAAGETAFGLWSGMASPFGAELLARAGADYVCVDLQHGLASFDGLTPLLQGIALGGALPLVRVAENEAWQIGKALDQGALGVIVPLVETAEEAARAVAACRYPPDGSRSFGPSRAGSAIGSLEPGHLGGEVVCLVMVETRRGVDNVAQIAATPGLDGIYIGPADLAVSLGVSPLARELGDEHARAIETIRDACAANGIVAGIHCARGEDANAFAARGFGIVTAATDFPLLAGAAARSLRAARGEE